MRRQIERTLLILLGIGAAVIPIRSQTKPQKPSFETVSLKPSSPGFDFRLGGPRGDRLTLPRASLKGLMGMAYRESEKGEPLEIFGGPDWMESALYEVQAKADCSGGIISGDQLALMVQSMLEDRFQLKVHLETREMPVYNLVVGKDGPKLKASADQTPPDLTMGMGFSALCGPVTGAAPAPPPLLPAPGADMSQFMSQALSQLPRGQMIILPQQPGAMTLQGRATPVSRLVFTLKLTTGWRLIDKTWLTGLFDIAFKFSTDGLARPFGVTPGGPASGPPGGPLAGPEVNGTVAPDPAPTLFSAIQDLGLKLESARGPVQVVVIDSVQKPSAN